MKICLVTTFPPSQGGLSEYGLHIARELRRNPFITLTVLADQTSLSQPELEGFSVLRCWTMDDPANALRLLRALQALKPDVVWFNLLFSTFGRNPVNAFLGLFTPLLARLSGRYTHVTLHHLMDTVDLKDAGVRYPLIYRVAGAVATRMLLFSNSVSVLMPGYRRILQDKYGRDNVHVRSHGVLTQRPEYPDFARRGNPEHRILAFGKWGTYKRLELMIDAFQIVNDAMQGAKLIIAGGDHPQASGYVESMRERSAGNGAIEFTGYVREDRLANLFQSSSVAVMPYSSSTGSSGVAHLACAYGVPIVCADLPDFRQMAEGEELAIEFYQPGNAQDLARCLIYLLTNVEKQQAMAVQNFSTALRMTMPTIVQKYLRHFELEQRTEALRRVTRFRRLPSWVPSKALMLRIMTRNSPGWVHRSAVHRPGWGEVQNVLSNRYVNGSRELGGTGVPKNGDGVTAGSGHRSALDSSTAAPTGNENHSSDKESGEDEDLSTAPMGRLSKEEAGNSEGEQPSGIHGDGLSPLGQIHPRGESAGNSKGGSRSAGTGSNAGGRERASQVTRDTDARERDGIVE